MNRADKRARNAEEQEARRKAQEGSYLAIVLGPVPYTSPRLKEILGEERSPMVRQARAQERFDAAARKRARKARRVMFDPRIPFVACTT